MAGDDVQELCAGIRFQWPRALFDQAKAEMHVAEQTSLVGWPKSGPARQLHRPADVVEECARE